MGDYALDNTNFGGRSDLSFERLPIDDDYDVIRHDVWHAMDRAYKQAAADYARKLATRKTQNQSPDDVGDFLTRAAVTDRGSSRNPVARRRPRRGHAPGNCRAPREVSRRFSRAKSH